MIYKGEPEDLNFGIVVDKRLIAVFGNSRGRDDCLSFLTEKWDDCKFIKINLTD